MTTDGGLHWTVVRAKVGGIKYDLEITTRARLQEGDLVSHGQSHAPYGSGGVGTSGTA